jgi:hypothetical protein
MLIEIKDFWLVIHNAVVCKVYYLRAHGYTHGFSGLSAGYIAQKNKNGEKRNYFHA